MEIPSEPFEKQKEIGCLSVRVKARLLFALHDRFLGLNKATLHRILIKWSVNADEERQRSALFSLMAVGVNEFSAHQSLGMMLETKRKIIKGEKAEIAQAPKLARIQGKKEKETKAAIFYLALKFERNKWANTLFAFKKMKEKELVGGRSQVSMRISELLLKQKETYCILRKLAEEIERKEKDERASLWEKRKTKMTRIFDREKQGKNALIVKESKKTKGMWALKENWVRETMKKSREVQEKIKKSKLKSLILLKTKKEKKVKWAQWTSATCEKSQILKETRRKSQEIAEEGESLSSSVDALQKAERNHSEKPTNKQSMRSFGAKRIKAFLHLKLLRFLYKLRIKAESEKTLDWMELAMSRNSSWRLIGLKVKLTQKSKRLGLTRWSHFVSREKAVRRLLFALENRKRARSLVSGMIFLCFFSVRLTLKNQASEKMKRVLESIFIRETSHPFRVSEFLKKRDSKTKLLIEESLKKKNRKYSKRFFSRAKKMVGNFEKLKRLFKTLDLSSVWERKKAALATWQKGNKREKARKLERALNGIIKREKLFGLFSLFFHFPALLYRRKLEKLKALANTFNFQKTKGLKKAFNKWQKEMKPNFWFELSTRRIALCGRINRQISFWRLMNISNVALAPCDSANISTWSSQIGARRLLSFQAQSLTPLESPPKSVTPNDSFSIQNRNYLGSSFDQSFSIHLLEPPNSGVPDTMAQLAQRGSLSMVLDKICNKERIKMAQGFERLRVISELQNNPKKLENQKTK